MAESSIKRKVARAGAPETAVKKLVRSQLKQLLPLLSTKNPNDEQIHIARQEIRKLRALIKLVRVPLGKQHYGNFNETLRQAAAKLSDVRDAAVVHETFEGLLRDNKQLNAKTLQPLRNTLRRYYRNERKRVLLDDLSANDQLAAVRQLQKQLGQWPVLPSGFAAFEQSLSKTYRSGRTALKDGREHPTTEHLHELRKQAKNLRYQISHLQHTWPRHQKMLEKSLHELTDLLGLDHDLAELLRWLEEHKWPNTSAQNAKTIRKTLLARQKQLRKQALGLARLIYAEKPKQFVNRQQAYWQSAETVNAYQTLTKRE